MRLSTFLSFTDAVDAAIDGKSCVLDPGNADAIRIVGNTDAANNYLAGLRGGVVGRVLLVLNASNTTIHVAHDYDPQATGADPTQRFRMESGPYDWLNNALKLVVYVTNPGGDTYWQIFGS